MAGRGSKGITLEEVAVLTTHFGDTDWVELLVRRLRGALPRLRDEQIFVVDQNRSTSSAEHLRRRLGRVRVLTYDRSEPHFVMTGHDHAHVLNLAVREIESDHLLLFDSDAHPVSPAFWPRLTTLLDSSDAVLAALRRVDERTHPCFMVFGPKVDRSRLRFDEGQLETGVDTGRMIHDQIAAMGLEAALLRPEPAFGGRWGTLYLDGEIYHHGSGSFEGAADPRLQAQAELFRRESAFFRRRVDAGRYQLRAPEGVVATALHAARARPDRGLVANMRRRVSGRARTPPAP